MKLPEYIEKFARLMYGPKYRERIFEELLTCAASGAGNNYCQKTARNLIESYKAERPVESLDWFGN